MSSTPRGARPLLENAAGRAARYLERIDERPVVPSAGDLAALDELVRPLPERGEDPARVLALLDERGGPATVASAGGRYFGLVVGGTQPASLAANVLAGAWDQAGGLAHSSPLAARFEEIALEWLREAFDLPPECGGGITTGATMANLSGLAAARHALLARHGWDVETRGLFGAPEPTVVVGGEAHVSVLKALGLLGLGSERVVRVPTDEQGRMRVDAFPRLDHPSILCLQAGNVNTGACDDAWTLCERARASGSWVHVDGAFGLWARVSPDRASLVEGIELADSWAVDCHKWLNVPYDSGVALCRHPEALRAAMAVDASYLMLEDVRHPADYTPEMSRCARGIEVWAAMLSLGRVGLVDLVERCCRHAARFAEELRAAGHEILNDVVLNQVLVSFGSDDETDRVIERIQDDGTCWCGGTKWHGRRAMRISVSSWATTVEDVEASLEVMLRAAGG